jgi:hypothetical protein
MSARGDLRKVIRDCERAGLVYEQGRHGHAKLRDPRTGRAIPVSCTPSDCYAPNNVLRDVRKYINVEVSP